MNLSIYRVLPISGNLFYLLLLKKSEQKIDKKYKNFSLSLLIILTICMLALVGFILYEWLIHLYHLDNYIKNTSTIRISIASLIFGISTLCFVFHILLFKYKLELVCNFLIQSTTNFDFKIANQTNMQINLLIKGDKQLLTINILRITNLISAICVEMFMFISTLSWKRMLIFYHDIHMTSIVMLFNIGKYILFDIVLYYLLIVIPFKINVTSKDNFDRDWYTSWNLFRWYLTLYVNIISIFLTIWFDCLNIKGNAWGAIAFFVLPPICLGISYIFKCIFYGIWLEKKTNLTNGKIVLYSIVPFMLAPVY